MRINNERRICVGAMAKPGTLRSSTSDVSFKGEDIDNRKVDFSKEVIEGQLR